MTNEDRSTCRYIQSQRDLKGWLDRPPSVAEVRPKQCPCCGSAGEPPGGPLGLHGHGVRERQLRGPLSPGAASTIVTVYCRRYVCKQCRAVLLVGPQPMMARRVYSASAIGLSLGLYGLLKQSTQTVRAAVSPWRVVGASAATHRWATLLRWIRAARDGALFAGLRQLSSARSLRDLAERAAMMLAAYAAPTERARPLCHQAFIGASQLSMASLC